MESLDVHVCRWLLLNRSLFQLYLFASLKALSVPFIDSLSTCATSSFPNLFARLSASWIPQQSLIVGSAPLSSNHVTTFTPSFPFAAYAIGVPQWFGSCSSVSIWLTFSRSSSTRNLSIAILSGFSAALQVAAPSAARCSVLWPIRALFSRSSLKLDTVPKPATLSVSGEYLNVSSSSAPSEIWAPCSRHHLTKPSSPITRSNSLCPLPAPLSGLRWFISHPIETTTSRSSMEGSVATQSGVSVSRDARSVASRYEVSGTEPLVTALERAKGRSERSSSSPRDISRVERFLMPSVIRRRGERDLLVSGAGETSKRPEVGSAAIVQTPFS